MEQAINNALAALNAVNANPTKENKEVAAAAIGLINGIYTEPYEEYSEQQRNGDTRGVQIVGLATIHGITVAKAKAATKKKAAAKK